MPEGNKTSSPSTTELVLLPVLITLGVTILRLVGELRHWSGRWFDPGSAIVGITWLAPVFGVYFALRLWSAGERTSKLGAALAFAAVGAVSLLFMVRFGFPMLHINLLGRLGVLWAVAVLAASLQYSSWPALFRTLAVYGLGARFPVVIIMLLAIRGRWQTHYNLVIFPNMGFWSQFLLVAIVAQLVFWVGFTVVAGALFGTAAVALFARKKPPPHL